MIKRAWVALVALGAAGAVAGCGSGEQEPSTITVVTGPLAAGGGARRAGARRDKGGERGGRR